MNNRVKAIEKRVAKEVGGRRCIMSGARWYMKSDVQSRKLQIEVKTTSKDYIYLRYSWLDKICQEARNTSRYPVLYIKSNEMSAYIVMQMLLRIYGLNDIIKAKCYKRSTGGQRGFMIKDNDIIFEVFGNRWVVLNVQEFGELHKRVSGNI